MKKTVSILLTVILILSSLTVFSDYGYMSNDETVISSITDEEKVCGYAENTDNATLILAYYSQNGRLLETRITTEAITPYINIDNIQPNGYFKLFVLDSANGLSPITQVSPLYHTYKTYVVGSVATTYKMIADLYRNTSQNNICILDDTDPDIIIDMKKASDGSEITLSTLAKYNVLSIKESLLSDGKKHIEAIVSDNKVTGKLDSINLDNKEIVVENQEYTLSEYILKYATAKTSDLTAGFYYNFYLDKDGKVAAFEEIENPDQMYAYICGVDMVSNAAKFIIIDQTGAKRTLFAAAEVKIDGILYGNPADIIDILTTSSNALLIKYATNSDSQIISVDTAMYNSFESELSLTLGIMRSDFKYKSANKEFSSLTSTNRFLIDKNTVIFSIPSDITSYDEYSVQTPDSFNNNQSYTVEAYDLTDTTVIKAKCIVVYN